MPTGYTAAVKDGISFDQFVFGCARAMGALIMMRDEPSSAPIPERFEPSDYYFQALKKAEEKLAWLMQMPLTEAGREAMKDFETKKEYVTRAIDEANALRAKYAAMLNRVNAWEPPTPDHEGFKDFMVKQLVESIDFDCGTDFWEREAPFLLSAADWKEAQIQAAEKNVEHYREEHRKEVERTEGRNAWLRALRESLAVESGAAA